MKNSVTFKLVARSTDDPLFCDPEAPQYVLVEKKSKEVIPIELDDNVGPEKKKLDKDSRRAEQAKFGVYFDDDYDYLQHLIDAEDVPTLKGIEIVSKEKMQSDDLPVELDELVNPQPSTSKGVAAAKQKPTLMLPSSVFESTVREKEALTKRAALPVGPQLDWDPDVVEAMDDDYNFDDPNNQIDDDFVSQAMVKGEAFEEDNSYLYDFTYKSLPKNLPPVDEQDQEEQEFDDDDDDDDLSVCGAASGSEDYDSDEARDLFPNSMAHIKDLLAKKHIKKYFNMEGTDDQFDDGASAKSTGSRFTEYSMSSSVVPRSEQLRQLDSQFEKMFISEYGDEEAIGALDGDEEFEEVDGEMDPSQQELMKAALEEFAEAKQERAGIEYVGNREAIDFVRTRFVAKHSKAGRDDGEDSESESGDDSDSDSEYEEIEVADTGRKGDKERLDCESVLSTFSNTTYHPRVLQDTDRYGNVLLGRQKTARPNHIRFDPRTGMPLAPAANDPQLLTSGNLAKLDALETGTARTNATRLSELSVRPKNETVEERRQRKKELKDYRAQRRAEKKANKVAFTEEKLRMAKQSLNSVVQKKVAVL